MIDLDGFAVGPREWDLALTAIYYDSFGWHTAAEYAAFGKVPQHFTPTDVIASTLPHCCSRIAGTAAWHIAIVERQLRSNASAYVVPDGCTSQ